MIVLNPSLAKIVFDEFSQMDGRGTHNSGYLVTLPSIKTEYVCRGFFFLGAKIYNELLLDV